MPQVVKCSECGEILYQGLELKPVDEIIIFYGGVCPKCCKKLDPPSKMRVEVIPAPKGELEIVPLLPKMKINSHPTSEEVKIPHDFLSVFDNNLKIFIEKYGIRNVLNEIWRVGGKATVRRGEILSLYLPLDASDYYEAYEAVRRNFRRQISEYVKRNFPVYSWQIADKKSVLLKVRVEYEERLLKKFERLKKILESA